MDEIRITSKIQIHITEFICDECKKPYGYYTLGSMINLMFKNEDPLSKEELSKIICVCHWKSFQKTKK